MSTIKIGPHSFQLEEVAKLADGDEDLYGICDFTTGTIRTCEGLRPLLKAETQMHEILHAMCTSSGILPDQETQEVVVTALASHLTMLAQQNPAWVHDWVERCKA